MSDKERAMPSEIPNDETIEAMQELENGGGKAYSGSTEDFFNMLLEED